MQPHEALIMFINLLIVIILFFFDPLWLIPFILHNILKRPLKYFSHSCQIFFSFPHKCHLSLCELKNNVPREIV